jgi:hypothetical protein
MSVDLWVIVGSVAGIFAAVLTLPIAYAAILDVVSNNEDLQHRLLAALPDPPRNADRTLAENGRLYRELTRGIRKPRRQIYAAIRKLMSDDAIVVESEPLTDLTNAFVFAPNGSSSRVLRPTFYKEALPPDRRPHQLSRADAQLLFRAPSLLEGIVTRTAVSSILSLLIVCAIAFFRPQNAAVAPAIADIGDLVGTWCAGGSKSLRFKWDRAGDRWEWTTTAESPIPRTWPPAVVDVRWFDDTHSIIRSNQPQYKDEDNDEGTVTLYYHLGNTPKGVHLELIGNPLLTKSDGTLKAFPLYTNKGFTTEWSRCE